MILMVIWSLVAGSAAVPTVPTVPAVAEIDPVPPEANISQTYSLSLIQNCFKTKCLPVPNIKCWTTWMDCDDPTGSGDYETITNLKNFYPKDMCPYPSAIEVASVDGIPLSNTGNIFTAQDTTTGLICSNSEQKCCYCRDYKVRFVCYAPYCGSQKVCWSNWYNRDSPGGTGDWELLSNLRSEYPGQICDTPILVESVTTATNSPATQMGQVFRTYSPTEGFVCVNVDQPLGKGCLDYKVRFACPC